MSILAADLLELRTYPQGALTQHLLREIAASLIGLYCDDQRGGL